VFQGSTPGILTPVTGDKDKIGEPPDTKAAQGKKLNNSRARPANIKAVSTEWPQEKR